jgi:hypothetical protein
MLRCVDAALKHQPCGMLSGEYSLGCSVWECPRTDASQAVTVSDDRGVTLLVIADDAL